MKLPPRTTLAQIRRVTEELVGVPEGADYNGRRMQKYVVCRQIVAYLAHEHLRSWSWPEVAAAFGAKSHTSFIDAGKRFLIDQDRPVPGVPGWTRLDVARRVLELVGHDPSRLKVLVVV